VSNVRCPNGHTKVVSHPRRDRKERTVAVVWECLICKEAVLVEPGGRTREHKQPSLAGVVLRTVRRKK